MLRGSIGFAVVSLVGFSVWAFAGRSLYAKVGEAGLYTLCLLVFLGSSGLVLHPLARGPQSLLRFYKAFIPAFLAYAIVWCAAWFIFRFGLGEWLGSLLGSVAFVAVTSRAFGKCHGIVRTSIILFGLHSAGYFLGGKSMQWLTGPAGAGMLTGFSKVQLAAIAKLSWGLLYGLGFGAGIGYAFCTCQRGSEPVSNTTA